MVVIVSVSCPETLKRTFQMSPDQVLQNSLKILLARRGKLPVFWCRRWDLNPLAPKGTAPQAGNALQMQEAKVPVIWYFCQPIFGFVLVRALHGRVAAAFLTVWVMMWTVLGGSQ
jgi:hypothetical protein